MDFGERLRKLRKGKYSQEELAALLKIHSNTISKWENGEMEPRSARVKQLAEIFHTTSAYLLGETDNPEPERTLPIEEPTEQPQASETETKSPTPLDLADKSIFEAIKSKDLPDPGIESRSPALEADALTSKPLGKLDHMGRETF